MKLVRDLMFQNIMMFKLSMENLHIQNLIQPSKDEQLHKSCKSWSDHIPPQNLDFFQVSHWSLDFLPFPVRVSEFGWALGIGAVGGTGGVSISANASSLILSCTLTFADSIEVCRNEWSPRDHSITSSQSN